MSQRNDEISEVRDLLQELREQKDGGKDFITSLTEGFEKLDKMTSGNKGKAFGEVFSSKEIKEYVKGLGDARRNIRYMERDYDKLGDSIKRIHNEMDDIIKKKGIQAVPISLIRSQGPIFAARDKLAGQISRGEQSIKSRERYAAEQRDAREKRDRMKVMGAVAMGGVAGYTMSRIQQGVSVLKRQEEAQLDMEGSLGIGKSRATNRFMNRGFGLNMNSSQSLPFMTQTGKAVGRMDASGAYSNMLLSRGRGLGMGDLTSFQSSARHAGDKSLGKALNDQMIASFRASGANPALMEEFLKGSTKVLQGMSPGSTSASGRDAAGLLSAMSTRLGGVYSRSPERTAGLLGRMNASMSSMGGSEQIQSFKLRSAGFGKGTSYWDAYQQVEKGATARNISSYIRQINTDYSGMGIKDRAGALMSVMGGNIKYHEAFSLMKTGGGGLAFDAQMASMGKGANQSALKRHIRSRSGQTGRSLGRELATAKLAGSKAGQKFLDIQTKADIAGMKTTGFAFKALGGTVNHVTFLLKGFGQVLQRLASGKGRWPSPPPNPKTKPGTKPGRNPKPVRTP